MISRKDSFIDNLIILIIVLIVMVCLFLFKNIQEIKYCNEVQTSEVVDSYSNTVGMGNLVKNSEEVKLEDSGIEYYIRSFDREFYPFYHMLSDVERDLYNQLYANIVNYKKVFVPGKIVSIREVEKSMEAIYNDHPEFFWLDSMFSFKYQKDGTVIQIILTFNETIENITRAKQLFDKRVAEILNVAMRMDKVYEKEKYVHDVLIDSIQYDLNESSNQSAYSALVLGRTVCAGYARAFQFIMIKLGVPTYYVTGKSKKEDHAWNMIKLDDEYYNVDLTWDDSGYSYKYFNITDSGFAKTHTRSGLSTLLPRCNGTYYSYSRMSMIEKDAEGEEWQTDSSNLVVYEEKLE